MKKIRICVVGCGAIGTWLGCRLGQLGNVELSCLIRTASLAALRSEGLRLSSAQHPQDAPTVFHPHRVSDDAKEIGVQDWVIVALKSTALKSSIPAWLPLIGKQTSIWTAMNGIPWWFMSGVQGELRGKRFACLDPNAEIASAVALEHWVGGVVHSSCALLGPGHTLHHFGTTLLAGEPDLQSSLTHSARVSELVGLLSSAGFDAQASKRIQNDIWYKLWGNMTINPISAITGATTDKILDDPFLRAFVSGIMLEAREIGSRVGIELTQSPEERHLVTQKLGAFKTSMLQDVLHKRPLELDALLGAVVELAQWTHVQAPLSSALLGLARVHAQTLGLYPT